MMINPFNTYFIDFDAIKVLGTVSKIQKDFYSFRSPDYPRYNFDLQRIQIAGPIVQWVNVGSLKDVKIFQDYVNQIAKEITLQEALDDLPS